MLQTDIISNFLNKKVIAVVGVSGKDDLPANHIFKKFRDSGYHVYPVNPNAEKVEGVKSYPTLSDLPERAEAVVMASTPSVTEKLMSECIDRNIKYVWMHKGIGQGSYSKKADENGVAHGVHVIRNGCPMMFVNQVDGFHKVLRWFKSF